MIDFDDLDKPVPNWQSVSLIMFFAALILMACLSNPHFWWEGIVTGVIAQLMGMGFLFAAGKAWRNERGIAIWMIVAAVVDLIAPWTSFLSWLGDHTILK